jgi:DNA polymerase III delta prime subunit
MKDAALIEEMNAFLNKTIEATEFMLTVHPARPEMVEPMLENEYIFVENIEKFKKALYSKAVSYCCAVPN